MGSHEGPPEQAPTMVLVLLALPLPPRLKLPMLRLVDADDVAKQKDSQ